MYKTFSPTGPIIGDYQLSLELTTSPEECTSLAIRISKPGEPMAFKLVSHRLLTSSTEQENFLRDAQRLKQLEHPHILPVLDYGIEQGMPFLITPYIASRSLAAYSKDQGQLPLQKALTLLSQIGQALDYAHQQHLLHGGLRPRYVRIDIHENPLLTNFCLPSLAAHKHVLSGSILTSHDPESKLYLAPEQFAGVCDEAGDQYSLACIAYELLTGQPIQTTAEEILPYPIAPHTLNPAIPPHIEQAILKALAHEPTERYSSIQEFLMELQVPLLEPATPTSIAGVSHYSISAPPSASNTTRVLSETSLSTSTEANICSESLNTLTSTADIYSRGEYTKDEHVEGTIENVQAGISALEILQQWVDEAQARRQTGKHQLPGSILPLTETSPALTTFQTDEQQIIVSLLPSILSISAAQEHTLEEADTNDGGDAHQEIIAQAHGTIQKTGISTPAHRAPVSLASFVSRHKNTQRGEQRPLPRFKSGVGSGFRAMLVVACLLLIVSAIGFFLIPTSTPHPSAQASQGDIVTDTSGLLTSPTAQATSSGGSVVLVNTPTPVAPQSNTASNSDAGSPPVPVSTQASTPMPPVPTQAPSHNPPAPQPTSPGPSSSPPTQVPPTQVPPTQVPPTQVPPTRTPPTQTPPTQTPPTQTPPTKTPTPSTGGGNPTPSTGGHGACPQLPCGITGQGGRTNGGPPIQAP